jgi:hypothetical protein
VNALFLLAVTPPGHYTTATATIKCPNGTYRADWKPPSDAVSSTCLSCGEGVKTVATDQLSVYATVGYAETKLSVTTSSDDCCKHTYKLLFLWAYTWQG